MGGGGGGRGNGRPLTTAYSSFGPSFQLWYLWTVVILVIIRPSNGNMKTRDTLKFSIAAASVLYSLKDVCRVVAEMWCGVFFCQENGLFMLPLKFIVSLLPHSVGAGWDSHWQIAFCSCCDLWRYSEVILTCHQRTDSKPFGFLQGCPYERCAVRDMDLLAYMCLLLNNWRGKLMRSEVPSWKIIALSLYCHSSI